MWISLFAISRIPGRLAIGHILAASTISSRASCHEQRQSTASLTGGCFSGQPTPMLYDRAVEVLRGRHYSRRTEEDLRPLDSRLHEGCWKREDYAYRRSA